MSPIYIPPGANPSSRDPFISNVISLVHGQGANGSTSFPDTGSLGAVWTAGGTAAISTAQQKFGTGSIYIPNVNSYIRNASVITTSLQNLNHTLEFWIYPTTWNASAGNALWTMGAGPLMGSYTEKPAGSTIQVNNQVDYYIGGALNIITTVTPINLNAWNWIAYEKTYDAGIASNIWTIRINGILNYVFFSGNPNPSGDNFTLGCQNTGAGGIIAYFQEMRLTKFPVNSTTRYNFTPYVPPPTTPFPDP